MIAAGIYLCLTILAMSAMYFLEKRAGRGIRRSA
jgi:putative lysine/arginine/ornithine/histidine/octopine transport system permease protein